MRFAQLHNDSTTIRFCGQYPTARRGSRLRGRPTPWITCGYSKDHRPDLKQLLFILTMSADGGVPVQFHCADGNTNDAETHRQTWDQVARYLTVRRTTRTEHRFRQMRRGRPGPDTPYRKTTRRHPDLEWRLNEAAVAYDRKSDGMYPELTDLQQRVLALLGVPVRAFRP